MGVASSKAFVLLDVLFGATLMIAVILLCGYFRQLATGFYSTSVGCRTLVNAYYERRGEDIETTLIFSQKSTNVVLQRHMTLEVVRRGGLPAMVIGAGNVAR